MTDPETPNAKPTQQNPPSSSNKVPSWSSPETGYSSGPKYPNPPETCNPDPIALREQWRFAIKQYSRWYSHAWGTAILAGLSFFALGWIIKGSNPLPSFKPENPQKSEDKSSADKANQEGP